MQTKKSSQIPNSTKQRNEKVLKEGWILKKSKHVKNYRKRFMQLKGDKLLCYKTDKFEQTNEPPTEIFDLSLDKYRLEKHNNVKGKFYLVNETIAKTRTFKARTESDRNDWVKIIINSIIQMEMEMHDSESEESDGDFGGYGISLTHKLRQTSIGSGTTRKPTISRRKTNLSISTKSFNNFRIRSLTVDNVDINKQNDRIEFKMECVAEEKEQLQHEQQEQEEEEEEDYQIDDELANMAVLASDNDIEIEEDFEGDEQINKGVLSSLNEDIIAQLEMFGYQREEIIKTMDCVINPNNINQIRDKLDAYICKIVDIDPVIEKRARMRKYIQAEIVSTEETYVDGLDILLNEFIEPIFANGYVDKKYYDLIRSSFPKIFNFHKDFLNKLKYVFSDNNADNKTLPSVFNKRIKQNKEEFIDKYMQLISDYDKILDLFGSVFHGNLELDHFLQEKRKEGKALSGYLISPVQRVPRYILLLTDLRKNTEMAHDDYADINDAVEMMEEITREINERKRKIENLSQCLQIQEVLTGLKECIVNDDRRFIEQFIFIKKCIKHQRLFLLFSDIVIVANEKWQVKHILDIRTLEVKVFKDNFKNGKSYKAKRKHVHLPEFELVSVGSGSVIYIGEDIDTIIKFRKLIGKWRVQIMSDDVRQRNETLGSLRNELSRQALLYD